MEKGICTSREDVDTLVVVGVEILVEVESEDDVDAELEELKGD